MGKRGRPKTGSGKTVSIYLSAERLSALGDDPVREIYRLIDEVYVIGPVMEVKPVDVEKIKKAVEEAKHQDFQALPNKVIHKVDESLAGLHDKRARCGKCVRMGWNPKCPECGEKK